MYCMEDIIVKQIEDGFHTVYLRRFKTPINDEDIYAVDVNYNSYYTTSNTTIYHTSNLDSAKHFFNLIYQNMISWRHDNR